MSADAVHDFRERLAWSHKMHALPIWKEAYQKAFPGCTMVLHEADGEHQRAGIDRSLILTNSKQILIDEKAREPIKDGPWPYSDILLEYISNDQTGAHGWAVKSLRADFIAYAILQTGQCYLLPVIQLQQAWIKNRDAWLGKRGAIKRAQNRGYVTVNCAVEVDVLFRAIGSCLRVQCNPMSWEQLQLFAVSKAA